MPRVQRERGDCVQRHRHAPVPKLHGAAAAADAQQRPAARVCAEFGLELRLGLGLGFGFG